MLAQNFKTPADLGITEEEFCALRTVLGMFERGEITSRQYNIGSLGSPECGTRACIRGWARHVSPGVFPGNCELPPELGKLFFLTNAAENSRAMRAPKFSADDPALAAAVLRNYLTHGEPRWAESGA